MLLSKNISEATEEIPQSRSTAPPSHPPTHTHSYPEHQKKERRWTNNDKTNATHETAEERTKKKCNRIAALERSEEKLPGNYRELFSDHVNCGTFYI